MGYLYLTLAIISEVIATNLLKGSLGFTKLSMSAMSLLVYGVCFYFLSKSLAYLPLNIAYALWGAVGILLITLFSIVYWKESINLPTALGIGLIIIGTLLVNYFGSSH